MDDDMPTRGNDMPTRDIAWQEDGLSNDDLASSISACKSCGIDFELQSLAQKISPSQTYRSQVGRCIGQLRAAAIKAAQALGQSSSIFTVEPYGSHVQGTDLDSSDTEVVLRVSPKLSKEQCDAFVDTVREQLEGSVHCEVSESMRNYNHTCAPMSLELKNVVPRMVAHVVVSEQPTRNADKRLSVDEVVKQLCDTCEPSRDVVRLVKLWATNNGIANQDGHLSSLVWTLLVVFFFQTQKLMPSYEQLAENRNTQISTGLRLSELLRGFFMFLSRRPTPSTCPQQGISVALAEEISAEVLGSAAGLSECLCIEDPAEFHSTKNHSRSNLAKNVGEAEWSQAIAEAKKVADRLCTRPQRWFHWGEIFDPRELPVDKIQKIESLKEVAARTTNLGSKQNEQAGGGQPMPVGCGAKNKDGFDPGVRSNGGAALPTKSGGKGAGTRALGLPQLSSPAAVGGMR